MDLQVVHEQAVLEQNFKVYGTVESPLFLARDVAEWIGYDPESINKLLAVVDQSEKLTGRLFRSGQGREMWFLTEDGLYEVLMLSRKPIAKEFKKQVKEILKSIRKNGVYATDDFISKAVSDPDFAIGILTKLKEERQARVELERMNTILQPKAIVHDRICNADGNRLLSEVGKVNGIGPKKIFQLLSDRGIIYRGREAWLPKQRYQDAGYFITRDYPSWTDSNGVEHMRLQLYVTPKGEAWIAKQLFAEEGVRGNG